MGILIGVLDLQGDVREHLDAVHRAGANAIPVKTQADIARVDGLIIPGGESTTIGKLLERFGLMEAVRQMSSDGKPIFGTCTGMILLATEIENSTQARLALMHITVRRNAFGRQIDSFEEDIEVLGIDDGPVRAVFIRAPFVTAVQSDVVVLALHNGHPILVREGHLLAAAFHPELCDDTRIHAMFIEMVRSARNANGLTQQS